MKKPRDTRLSDHHRRCRSNGGLTTKENVTQVLESHHRAFHLLFLNKDTYEIARILNEIWIDPRYILVVKERSTPL